jgi:hypothetical protein
VERERVGGEKERKTERGMRILYSVKEGFECEILLCVLLSSHEKCYT